MSIKDSSGSKCLNGGPPKMGIDKFTNTPPGMMDCAKCRDIEGLISSLRSTTFIEDYAKSFEYINACHNIINKLIVKADMPVFNMPDLPNFLDAFTSLYNTNRVNRQKFDNMESIEEIYSRIDALGTTSIKERDNKLACITNSDIKTEKTSTKIELISTDDGVLRKLKNGLPNRPRASSIPRRVNKGIQQQHQRIIQHNEGEKNLEDKTPNKENKDCKVHFANSTETLQSVNTANNKKIKHRNTSRIDMNNLEISQEQLEKYAKELLQSYGHSFSTTTPEVSPEVTPRAKIGNIGVPEETKSELDMQSSVLNCNIKKSMECNIDENKMLDDVLLKNPIKEESEYKENTDLNISSALNNFLDSKLDKSAILLPPVSKKKPNNKSKVCRIITYDTSDIETDENLSNENLVINKVAKNINIPQVKYIPKQLKMPIKSSFSDTEIKSDKSNKLISQSGIEADQFYKNPPTKKASMSRLCPSTSVSLPLDVLLDIGILTEDGNIRPDMMEELEKMKNARSTDKQNSTFRQPRIQEEDNSNILHMLDIADVNDEIHSDEDQAQDNLLSV